jgi:type II secretory pathway component PulF
VGLLSVVTNVALIVGLVIEVAFLLLVLMAIAVVWKVSQVVSSAKRTIEDTQHIVSTVSDKVVRPAAAGSGVVFGVGRLLRFLLRRSNRDKRRTKGGRNNGE